MRIRRRLPIWLGVLLVVAAVALAVVLRKHAPPEPARLLPSADGFVYVNLKWFRRANLTGQLPAVSPAPSYEQFIQATGFQFERDLDQAAIAIHYPERRAKTASDSPCFSEVLVGRIDGERVQAYFQSLAKSVETYRSRDIYSIPIEGRTFRAVILGPDTVAASNEPNQQVIEGIVDRSRKLASPFGGPPLLRQYYKQIPLASLAWAVFRVDPEGKSVAGAPDISFLFAQPAVVVVSARYLRALHLRAEAFAGNQEQAQRVTQQVGTFLTLFHAAETAAPAHGADPDVKQFLDSLKVTQQNDRAVLTASVPPGFIRKAIASPDEFEAPGKVSPK